MIMAAGGKDEMRTLDGDDRLSLEHHVESVVHSFLRGHWAISLRGKDVDKVVEQCSHVLGRVLKRQKSASTQEYPVIVNALSNMIGHVKPRRYDYISDEMLRHCTHGIAWCLCDMKVNRYHCKCDAMIVGMLYLMRQGLKICNKEWLPRVHDLEYCLPHEGCLDKFANLSTKIICETENEIKLVLRQRIHTL